MQPITMAFKLYLHTTRKINYFIYLENNQGYPSQQQSHSRKTFGIEGENALRDMQAL